MKYCLSSRVSKEYLQNVDEIKLKYINNVEDEIFRIIKLNPNDTQYLHSGKYFYTIKVKFSDSELSVQTIIDNREFWILD